MARAPKKRQKLGLKLDPKQWEILIRRDQPKTTCVFDSYWHFAHIRQQVYFRRLSGLPAPWTNDAVIQTYRFTNVYRAADRVSQYLIRHVIYGDWKCRDTDDLLFRVLLFKLFNKIETWQLLENHLGQLSWGSYDFKAYDRVLSNAMESGRRIYSAAYIMPACAAMSGGDGRKHRTHLRLIEHMIRDRVANRLARSGCMADAFLVMRSYPMLGDFLAYQYVIDLNYSPLMEFTEDEFVMPGPGARDGLKKVFSDPGEFNEADLIRWVADRQEEEFVRRGLGFQSLWGRRLQLIDCQNIFCEISKYARVKHPEITGVSGRVRIKQKFSVAGSLPVPWFPPKWGLNEMIMQSMHSQAVPLSEDLFTHINSAAAE